jgi:hypothetical protein
MQVQAAKGAGRSRVFRGTLVVAILLGVTLSTAALATIVTRSDTTAPVEESIVLNPEVAVAQADIQEDAGSYVLPDHAAIDRPEAHTSMGQGEGLIDTQRRPGAGATPALGAETMRFLEQNLYLPDGADKTSDMELLLQWYGEPEHWERAQLLDPEIPTVPNDYREWVRGQWTEGLTNR